MTTEKMVLADTGSTRRRTFTIGTQKRRSTVAKLPLAIFGQSDPSNNQRLTFRKFSTFLIETERTKQRTFFRERDCEEDLMKPCSYGELNKVTEVHEGQKASFFD